MSEKTKVTIEATVNSPAETIWEYWSKPEHIVKWNTATESWHTPFSENDLKTGGRFKTRMEAKDGSMGFDFSGTYDEVRKPEYIAYTLDDERKVWINFTEDQGTTKIVQVFEAEGENPVEFQQAGWQSILDNFKKYVEENK